MSSYSAGHLSVPVYYNAKDNNQKPTAIIIMDFGIAMFHDEGHIEKDKVTITLLSHGKCCMFIKRTPSPQCQSKAPSPNLRNSTDALLP